MYNDNIGENPIIINTDSNEIFTKIIGGDVVKLDSSIIEDNKFIIQGYDSNGKVLANGIPLDSSSHLILFVPYNDSSLYLNAIEDLYEYVSKDDIVRNKINSNIFYYSEKSTTKMLLYDKKYDNIFIVSKQNWKNYKNNQTYQPNLLRLNPENYDSTKQYPLSIIFQRPLSNCNNPYCIQSEKCVKCNNGTYKCVEYNCLDTQYWSCSSNKCVCNPGLKFCENGTKCCVNCNENDKCESQEN